MPKFNSIAVLMGGWSSEREVSLRSGHAVVDALTDRGYRVIPVDVDRSIDMTLRGLQVDLVFNALHGRFGEDGCVQGLLELLGLPYTGSGVLASALSMHKVRAKEIFRAHNLPTPPYYVLSRERFVDLHAVHGAFGLPVIVKPVSEGSSFGVAVATDLDELERACAAALHYGDEVLVERFIVGTEVHVAVLSGSALGAIEVAHPGPLFDYNAKYESAATSYHCPPRLPAERLRDLCELAERAHAALGCRGATRTNMIIGSLQNEYILEVNTGPGLTQTSLLPRIASHAGMSFGELVEAILVEAWERTHTHQSCGQSPV